MSPTTQHLILGVQTTDVILGVAPAVFGLLGTLLGAGLTVQASRAERHAKADDEARSQLLDVSHAIHRVSWFSKFGASTPDDLSDGPGGIRPAVRSSVKGARAALLNAGIPYRIASVALDPTERLDLRLSSRTMHAEDPDDAQTLVAFLLGVLEHRRAYRHSNQILNRLDAMEELARGRRPLEGYDETQAPFGQKP